VFNLVLQRLLRHEAVVTVFKIDVVGLYRVVATNSTPEIFVYPWAVSKEMI
jgi:hypothetical protein